MESNEVHALMTSLVVLAAFNDGDKLEVVELASFERCLLPNLLDLPYKTDNTH